MIHGTGAFADLLRHETTERLFVPEDVHWFAGQVGTHDGKPLIGQATKTIADVCDTLPAGTLTIISTQLQVGMCRELETVYPKLLFAVIPENIRVHSGNPTLYTTRHVVGCRHTYLYDFFRELLNPYGRVLWMTPESAEMTKHALNTFLALNIVFGNEIGRLCEQQGADPVSVVAALRSEIRISDDAPIEPGPEPSEHLLREVHTMINIGAGPLIAELLR